MPSRFRALLLLLLALLALALVPAAVHAQCSAITTPMGCMAEGDACVWDGAQCIDNVPPPTCADFSDSEQVCLNERPPELGCSWDRWNSACRAPACSDYPNRDQCNDYSYSACAWDDATSLCVNIPPSIVRRNSLSPEPVNGNPVVLGSLLRHYLSVQVYEASANIGFAVQFVGPQTDPIAYRLVPWVDRGGFELLAVDLTVTEEYVQDGQFVPPPFVVYVSATVDGAPKEYATNTVAFEPVPVQPTPVDCVQAAPVNGTCNCTTHTLIQNATILVAPSNGGQACPYPETLTFPCTCPPACERAGIVPITGCVDYAAANGLQCEAKLSNPRACQAASCASFANRSFCETRFVSACAWTPDGCRRTPLSPLLGTDHHAARIVGFPGQFPNPTASGWVGAGAVLTYRVSVSVYYHTALGVNKASVVYTQIQNGSPVPLVSPITLQTGAVTGASSAYTFSFTVPTLPAGTDFYQPAPVTGWINFTFPNGTSLATFATNTLPFDPYPYEPTNCTQAAPVNGTCDCATGTLTQTATILVAPSTYGTACPYPETQTFPCVCASEPDPDQVNCVQESPTFSACDCSTPELSWTTRTATVVTPPSGGGAVCPLPETSTFPCPSCALVSAVFTPPARPEGLNRPLVPGDVLSFTCTIQNLHGTPGLTVIGVHMDDRQEGPFPLSLDGNVFEWTIVVQAHWPSDNTLSGFNSVDLFIDGTRAGFVSERAEIFMGAIATCGDFHDFTSCTQAVGVGPEGCRWSSWTPGLQPSACVAGSCEHLATLQPLGRACNVTTVSACTTRWCEQQPELASLVMGAPFQLLLEPTIANSWNPQGLPIGHTDQWILRMTNTGNIPIKPVQVSVDGVAVSNCDTTQVLPPVADVPNFYLLCTLDPFTITAEDQARGYRTWNFVVELVDTSDYSRTGMTMTSRTTQVLQPTPEDPCAAHTTLQSCRGDNATACAWQWLPTPTCVAGNCSTFGTEETCFDALGNSTCAWNGNNRKCVPASVITLRRMGPMRTSVPAPIPLGQRAEFPVHARLLGPIGDTQVHGRLVASFIAVPIVRPVSSSAIFDQPDLDRLLEISSDAPLGTVFPAVLYYFFQAVDLDLVTNGVAHLPSISTRVSVSNAQGVRVALLTSFNTLALDPVNVTLDCVQRAPVTSACACPAGSTNGTQTVTRAIQVAPAGDGAPCPHPVNETRACTCPAPPPPPVPAPAPSDPGTPLTTVTIVFDAPQMVADPEAFKAQLCAEVRALTNTTAECTVVLLQPQSADTRMLLTAAQALQQFLEAGAQTNLSRTDYPVFSTSRQIVPVPGSVDPSLPTKAAYDLTCNRGLNCAGGPAYNRSTQQCLRGVCSCVTDAQGLCVDSSFCVSTGTGTDKLPAAGGATTGFADVCFHPESTPDRLVYDLETCAAHDPSFVNVCPGRRFCQARDRSVHTDRAVFMAMLGHPTAAPPALLFTVQSPFTLEELLQPAHRDPVTQTICFHAYVSNLYDGAAPRGNKVWSHLCADSFYSNTTLQLTQLRFLDSVEGEPGAFFHANRWRALDPPPPPLSCARWSPALNDTTWSCQFHHVYNPTTRACEPGCANGLIGPFCSINPRDVCGPQTQVYTAQGGGFNATSTLYWGRRCHEVVCQPGFALAPFGGCEPAASLVAPPADAWVPQPPPEPVDGSLGNSLVVVAVVVGGALAATAIAFLLGFVVGTLVKCLRPRSDPVVHISIPPELFQRRSGLSGRSSTSSSRSRSTSRVGRKV